MSLLGKYTYSNWSNTEFSAATMKGWHTNLCSVPYFSDVFQLKKMIKKICHIYAMGYYSLVKKLTWNLSVTRKKKQAAEDITQTQKDKYDRHSQISGYSLLNKW